VNTRVLILGAAGRDFHNFNMVYRDDPATHVVAFTRAQIPRTGDRRHPASLAGPHYRNGIPIEDEAAWRPSADGSRSTRSYSRTAMSRMPSSCI